MDVGLLSVSLFHSISKKKRIFQSKENKSSLKNGKSLSLCFEWHFLFILSIAQKMKITKWTAPKVFDP